MIKQEFNKNWLFWKENSPKQIVNLPHDAMQTEIRSADAESGAGCAYFHGGIYHYEKTFFAPNVWEQRHVLFQFEGVWQKSRVLINGVEAGGAVYGFAPFFVCVDRMLRYGTENVIEVIADNTLMPNSRFYTGAGIYRPVWLWTGEKGCIEPEQIKIKTLSIAPARICVETAADTQIEILDGDTVVADGKGPKAEITIPNPTLWSAETPYLYTCRVKNAVDTDSTRFGIRTVTWDNKGLYVNGRKTLLKGGCVHHDNGIVGACAYAESDWRKVKLLKEAGFNAIRCAHNPANTALLDACDTIGLYVMDETWDMWYRKKTLHDYSTQFMEHYKENIQAMVRRDQPHPSVILYSIGNEVSEPAEEKGVALAKEMIAFFHSLDDSRPVTAGINLMIVSRTAGGNAIYSEDGGLNQTQDPNEKMSGMNSTMFNIMAMAVGRGMNMAANFGQADAATTPVLDALDIAGYNYASGRYRMEGKKHPDRLIFGSETFPQDIARNWRLVQKLPWLIGDFMWSAIDYLGETGSGSWIYPPDKKGWDKPYPWLLAEQGAIDLLGCPTGDMYLAQAVWGVLKAPAIAVQPPIHGNAHPAKSTWRGSNGIPCWSWSGCEGSRTVVEVYTDQPVVELKLNGKRVGKKAVHGCKAVFVLKYAPGCLEAVAYDGKKRRVSTTALETATHADICLVQEETLLKDGDIRYIAVNIGDEHGNVEGSRNKKLTAQVTGGTLLAFGSAAPKTEERYLDGSYTTYYGRALAAVRLQPGEETMLTVSDGVNEQHLKVI